MKLFKRQKNIEEPDNYEYWKDPRLGTDEDEGVYDFYTEELPSDTAKWQWYYQKCDSCGKYHRRNFVSTHYFYCWDGWDEMTYVECWKCRLKDKIYTIKAKIKRRIKARKEYYSWIKLFKEKGVEITEELKKTTLNLVNKEVMR